MDKKKLSVKRSCLHVVCYVALSLVLSSCGDTIARQNGYVNDNARVLDSRTVSDINALSGEIKTKGGVEFVVLTVKDTGSLSLAEYAARISNEWKIGVKDGADKGVLLLISVKDKAAYIWNTPSLDGAFSAIRKKIITEVLMSPGLKGGDYNKAAAAAIVESAKIIRNFLKAAIQPVNNNI